MCGPDLVPAALPLGHYCANSGSKQCHQGKMASYRKFVQVKLALTGKAVAVVPQLLEAHSFDLLASLHR